MVLSVIRAVGANIAVNAAQAHEIVAGILCIIFFSASSFSSFFSCVRVFFSLCSFFAPTFSALANTNRF